MLRFVLIGVAFLCVALPANAQPNGVSKNAGSQSNSVKTQTKPLQDAPPLLPLAVQKAIERIPSVLEATNANKPSAKEEDRAERNVRAQEQLAAWGPWMFRLGVAEIILTAIGVWLLYNTLREAKNTSRDSAAQAKIAHQTYISSNRPKLRMRLLRIEKPEIGKPIKVQYEVVNIGGTKAKIVSNEITMRKDYWIENKRLTTSQTRQFHFVDELRQGEAMPAIGEVMVADPQWARENIAWWSSHFFIIGMIRYMDDNGVLRRTAFYRQGTSDFNRFIFPEFDTSTSLDHEYED